MTSTSGGPIVVGIDFSPESRQALTAAAALAGQLGAALHVVSAVEPLLAEAALQANQLKPYLEQIGNDLRAFAAESPGAGAALTCEAQVGEPAVLLTAAADRLRARLIVVGSRGHGRAARLLLGSTTMRVLRSTNHSVLVTDWRDQQSSGDANSQPVRVTNIVCGVDFSDGSLAAVKEAVKLSADLKASLALVHARASDSSRGSEPAKLAAIVRDHALGADVRVRDGEAPEVLAQEADGTAGTLIVVGLRGAAKARPGQTALAVLASASVPVVGVPS